MKVEQIQSLINNYIDNQNFEGSPSELYAPISYIMSQGGKRMRPTLCLLACDMFGGNVDDCMIPAVAAEIFHNFRMYNILIFCLKFFPGGISIIICHFQGIHDVVDAVAFQDGHIDYDELDAFFSVNKKMADKYGMQCWTNAETFDRDMPIKFLPIKFDKLRLKLEAAKRCGYDKAITFEFPHFLSPQSVYGAAGNLYNRYKEYFNIK